MAVFAEQLHVVDRESAIVDQRHDMIEVQPDNAPPFFQAALRAAVAALFRDMELCVIGARDQLPFLEATGLVGAAVVPRALPSVAADLASAAADSARTRRAWAERGTSMRRFANVFRDLSGSAAPGSFTHWSSAAHFARVHV